MGKMQRDKGANFERAISITLRTVWPSARRGIGQARSSSEVPDVDGTRYWIETKHRRTVSISAAMAQARAATDGRPPVVITKVNRAEPMVTMLLRDWLELHGGAK